MATPAQLTAAVANAQHSTGPRTTEGKAASSRNALTFGIFANADLLPGEDPAALEELTREITGEFHPQNFLETALCRQVIHGMWLHERFIRIENEIAQLRAAALPAGAEHALGRVYADDLAGAKVLEKVDRRRRAALRQYNDALDQLHVIAAARRRQAQVEAFAARGAGSVGYALRSETGPANPVNHMPANPVRFDTHLKAAAPARPAPPDNPALRL